MSTTSHALVSIGDPLLKETGKDYTLVESNSLLVKMAMNAFTCLFQLSLQHTPPKMRTGYCLHSDLRGDGELGGDM